MGPGDVAWIVGALLAIWTVWELLPQRYWHKSWKKKDPLETEELEDE